MSQISSGVSFDSICRRADITDIPDAASIPRFYTGISILPDGRLATLPLLDGIRVIDPLTGEDSPLGEKIPGFVQVLAADNQGKPLLWGPAERLILSDGDILARALRIRSDNFLQPRYIKVVPGDWTPPPVPEPTTCDMFAWGLLALVAARRSSG